MKRVTTKIRLNALMSERNIKQVDILNKCEPFCLKYNVKIGKSDLSQYVNGKTEPSQDKLVILGMALDVSEAWLMGFDVPMERNKSAVSEKSEILTVSEHKLLIAFRALNEQGQENALATVEGLTYLSQYKKSDEYSMVEKSS